MSVLIAARCPQTRRVWIGSDGRLTMDGVYAQTNDKWVSLGPWTVGVTGVRVTRQILEADAADIGGACSIHELLARIDACLIGHGYEREMHPGGAPTFAQTLIVARGDRGGELWNVGTDRCFVRVDEVTDGSGWEMALGAYRAGRLHGASIESAIRTALEVCGACLGTVGPPYYVRELCHDRA